MFQLAWMELNTVLDRIGPSEHPYFTQEAIPDPSSARNMGKNRLGERK